MSPVFVVLATTAGAIALVVAARVGDTRRWRKSLVAFRLMVPRELTVESVAYALAVMAGTTTRRDGLCLEICADHRGISHYLIVPQAHAPGLLTRVSATLPGARLDPAPDGYLSACPAVRRARECRTRGLWRPLAAEHASATVTGLLAAMYPLARDETVRVQWIFQRASRIRILGDVDTRVIRDIGQKQAFPLVNAVGRIAVTADRRGRSRLVMAAVITALHTITATGASLSIRFLPSVLVARRISARTLPLFGWPCLFNANEAAAVVAIPIGGLTIPGLGYAGARQLPAPANMPNNGMLLASSNYPGMVGRRLYIRNDDRLRHMSINGPTGTGKSTLIANLAVQDITAGYGTVVVDPKSDLIEEILRRIPDNRMDDVIVLDPSVTDRPIGLNVLRCAGNDNARELVVDRVTHILASLWRSSWGPRTDDVIRASLLTLVFARSADGSAYTLAELPELLTNSGFRQRVVHQASIPESVHEFWAQYEELSDFERAQVIGPTLNKIRAFTLRTPLRLMLGQSDGLSLSEVFTQRKILLIPLSKGVIGPDAGDLLGSLIVGMLWQETLNRSKVPAEQRRPVFAYLDEFQDIVRMRGSELADMLAQARGLGLGVILAHQYLDQIPDDVLNALLGTVRSQIVFQLQYRDAQKLARSFAPLDTTDLTGLAAWEVAIRPCVNAATLAPVTGTTAPLTDPLRPDGTGIARASRERYGTPRADVEEARRNRIHAPRSDDGFGRTERRHQP